ncbi:MAG TPA: hypothetical protein VM366_10930 [Anaerolineae bacterium]|nr:hypothetical protein [Anaerolineae bacterium]
MPNRDRAHAADLRGAISIGLQESLRALEEALADLSEAHFRAFPMIGEENIALIALRTLQDLDAHAVIAQGGAASFPHADNWVPGGLSEAADYGEGAQFPSREQVLAWLGDVRRSAETLLASATDDDLTVQRNSESSWPGSASSAYLTTVFHAMAQVQRIWLLRGLLRTTGRSRMEVARETASTSTESPRAVAELHYGAVVDGNLFVWRATLIRELRSPRRVSVAAPQSWWVVGRRAVEKGAAYSFCREESGDDTVRRLAFTCRRDAGATETSVSIQLTLTDEGWRVNAAEY